MKIVSWNCNGKFREKFSQIVEEAADIYVICECENPAESTDEDYIEFAGDNYFWTGDLHYKGLGIFACDGVEIEKLEFNGDFKHFIPVCVNDSFNLLGVWAMPKYVEMIHDFFDANVDLFDENILEKFTENMPPSDILHAPTCNLCKNRKCIGIISDSKFDIQS